MLIVGVAECKCLFALPLPKYLSHSIAGKLILSNTEDYIPNKGFEIPHQHLLLMQLKEQWNSLLTFGYNNM